MTTTLRTFWRIMPYVWPHKWRLVVGTLAGIAAGGSLFGLLQLSPDVIRPFELAVAPAAAGQAAPATVTGGAESAAPAAGPGAAAATPGLGLATRLAERFGVPLERPDGGISWQLLLFTLLGLPILVLLKAAATYVNHYYMRWVATRVVTDIRNDLFANLQRQSLAYFGKVDVGELISRCTNDTSVVEGAVAATVADLVRAPVEIGAALAFIAWFSVHKNLLGVLVVVVVGFPLFVLPVVVLGRTVRRYVRRALEKISVLVSRMQENFTGIRVVKAFHMEEAEATRFRDMNRRYFHDVIKATRAELLMSPLMEAVALLCAGAFIIFCYARGVRLSEIAPIGLAAITAYNPTRQLAKVNANLQRTVAALERILAILDTDTSVPEAPNPVRIAAFTDRIVFDHVSFRYDQASPAVLTDVSFEVPRGSVVAFVGETGSGKTTVANLLARFYDPTEGRVTLDGHDLRTIEIAALRRLVGAVTQETILFNETIASNIAYGSPAATRAQVEAAARQANAHDFICAEPEGYDRVVGDKGFRLSGGQRQRIAIARAILRNPPILILDEATSALDTVTEQLVQEAIAHVMADRTVFAIAHRLSTIRNANLICLLDGGQIVERGTHAELYAAGGRYRRLCDLQFT